MTTAIPNKLIRIILTALLIVAAVYPIFSRSVNAGALTAMSDTMSRQEDTTASNHTISFTMTAGTTMIENETMTITFPAAFDTSTVDCGDVDLLDDGVEEDVQEEAASCTANSTEWGAVWSSDVLTLTAPSNAATYLSASSVVTVEIGTNATNDETGNEQIVNPGSPGSNSISIGGNFGDTGTFAVPIMDDDDVTVSATVDPSITFSLETTTCSLGTLGVGAINFCEYDSTVNTNAGSGFVSTIVESANLASGGNDIDDAGGDNDVDQGSEEYGVSSNDGTGTQDVVDTGGAGCDDDSNVEAASAITGTAKVYADSGDGDIGPVSNRVTVVCHKASVAGTTPAGVYSHVVTHITTGTF